MKRKMAAIDVWSAGVILLSLFAGHFPFFQSTDDGEALLEIACMFGKEAMQKVASRFSMLLSQISLFPSPFHFELLY